MKETKENNMMCMNCEGKGYLEDVVSIGVSVGDPIVTGKQIGRAHV